MGFNKRILPQLSEMEKIYHQDPDGYIKGIIKVDALIGSMECLDWVNEKIKKYHERNVKK
jgi:hypothetical protein